MVNTQYSKTVMAGIINTKATERETVGDKYNIWNIMQEAVQEKDVLLRVVKMVVKMVVKSVRDGENLWGRTPQ